MLSLYALSLVLSAQAQDPDYRQPANWLCRPGHNEACEQNLDTTVIAADGSRTIERFAAAKAPKFDCFYVYPTISNDPGGNSDLVPGPEERRVVQFQAARFGAKCRLFSPMYRQVTLTALRSMIGGATPRAIREHLQLNRPIYARTAAYGHFGRQPDNEGGFSWEKTDLADALRREA